MHSTPHLFFINIIQHVVFGLKILCAFLVPDVPGAVQIAIDREKYLAKVALEGVDDKGMLGQTGGDPETSNV